MSHIIAPENPESLIQSRASNFHHNVQKSKNEMARGEFEKITKKKLNSLDTKIPQANKNKPKKEDSGTKIAPDKLLANFAKEFERHIISHMWKIAYSVAKEGKQQDISDILYGEQFIDKMVENAYEEPGPLAKAVAEKMMIEYGTLMEGENHEKKGLDTKL
ncbi:MAG: hypothetical protein SFT91_01590 [Rickettsiaceae bacterium]|nr:hypothetical protein [Rickettsiaceae bacterium]